MEENGNIQKVFFERIKDQLPTHISLVDEVSELLDMSTDSAYRRLRCETSLSFEEIAMLSAHYGLSVDEISQGESDLISFQFNRPSEGETSFLDYMEGVLADLQMVAQFDEKEVLYLDNGIPMFHLFYIPEVAAFKFFLWQKTVLGFEGSSEKFSLKNVDPKINEISRQLRDTYSMIPSVEIIHPGTIDFTLQQIEYYAISGLFEKEEYAELLCDKLSDLVAHMQAMAEIGYKYNLESKPATPELMERQGGYELYFNDVLSIDNTVLVRAGEERMVYLINMTLSSIVTRNRTFFDDTYRTVQNLLKKSTLISGTSEKERNRIFRDYRKRISQLRERL